MNARPNPTLRLAAALALTVASSVHAADYTWDGGTGYWTDANWNPGPVAGPTTAGNTATINSGTVTANVGVGALDSVTLGSGAQLNFYNGDGGIYAYQGTGNLILQGGTVNGGSATYHAYGASLLNNLTVSGSTASTITGGSWFNLNSTTTFTVADVTGNSATDLLVSTSLRALPVSGNDWAYDTAAIIKEGAGTMEVTVHSYFRGGLSLNGGTLKVSGGNGGYGFFSGVVNVNSGTTLETVSDGTGLGWVNDWKPTSVNINGGTITTAGTSHIWGISGGINMTGGTLQSNGGVSDPNGGQLEWNHTSVTTNASADTATIGGRIRIRTDGGYSGISFNVADGGAATDLLVSAAINEANGAVGITKSGDGTMELSGSNSYAGATVVSAGTLKVSGSISTSDVTVNGGILASGSTGTVGKNVTLNSGATLAAGNVGAVGTATVANNLNFSSGSIFDWDLTTGSGDGSYDTVAVTGALNITSGAVFNVVSSTAFSDAFWNSTHTWSDIFGGKAIDNFLVSNFLYSGSATAPATEGYFTVSGTSLTWTAVPEPTSALAGLLLGAGILRRRRKE